MRSQNLFNEKEKSLWNCAKDVVVYNYQDYKFCSVKENNNLNNM
ncbi:MAG: hypothetical protein ACVCEJ_00315 [Candidatus Izemoplasmataceae bacterium]